MGRPRSNAREFEANFPQLSKPRVNPCHIKNTRAAMRRIKLDINNGKYT